MSHKDHGKDLKRNHYIQQRHDEQTNVVPSSGPNKSTETDNSVGTDLHYSAFHTRERSNPTQLRVQARGKHHAPVKP